MRPFKGGGRALVAEGVTTSTTRRTMIPGADDWTSALPPTRGEGHSAVATHTRPCSAYTRGGLAQRSSPCGQSMRLSAVDITLLVPVRVYVRSQSKCMQEPCHAHAANAARAKKKQGGRGLSRANEVAQG